MISRRVLLLGPALLTSGCGYHVAGRADLLPKTLKTIAIPAFGNTTGRYRLNELLPRALTREFIARTRYQVVPDENEADAVLRGAVLNYFYFPTVVGEGRSVGVQVQVGVQVSLTERATGKALYTQPNLEVRNRYEIAVDPRVYFEESDVALERVSRDVARSVVSAVLEGF